MRTYSTFLAILTFSFQLNATTLHIGQGQQFANFEQAAAVAMPGDTILFHAGVHQGGQYVANLKGTSDSWITISNASGEEAIIEGGNNAIQFSDPAYLHVVGLIFEHQTGNGVNTDDGGTYDSPAHHVIYENCTFRDMSVNGNNDLLKLSGLDFFEIRNCTFMNGAAGGSGIDMVGCHNGIIKGNYFENMGSNSIQAKGGTQHIRIEANYFKNGGQRTLNLGGSTGLQYFRPIDAAFEAANLLVYSNIIVGSWAAIAYVGAVNVEVVNNTIYQPENWVIRILQETVDPDRFVECGDNVFRNNIVHLSNNLSTETNIGPNTRPESFTFSNNLWYNIDDPFWNGPNIPVTDEDWILNEDPEFLDPQNNDFLIPISSPAAGSGIEVTQPQYDFYEMGFGSPPSIGAIEANPMTHDFEPFSNIQSFDLFPNPGGHHLTVTYILEHSAPVQIELINQIGQRQVLMPYKKMEAGGHEFFTDITAPSGWYLVKMTAGAEYSVQNWLRLDAKP